MGTISHKKERESTEGFQNVFVCLYVCMFGKREKSMTVSDMCCKVNHL